MALGNHKSWTKINSWGFSLLHGQARKGKLVFMLEVSGHRGASPGCQSVGMTQGSVRGCGAANLQLYQPSPPGAGEQLEEKLLG